MTHEQMTQETEQIFSSTGSLGVSRRQYDRLYVNGTQFADNPDTVVDNYQRLANITDRYPDRLSRGVYRGAVSQEVFARIQNSDLYRQLEVALPLHEFGDSSWLVYLAHNHEDRTQIADTETMIRNVDRNVDRGLLPEDRVNEVVTDRGYHFVTAFAPEQTGQILDLWSETFGWEEHEVNNLRHRLERERTLPPHQRDAWFSAVCDNGTIISAAMAERLTIPISGQRSLDLVESTEWRTRDEYTGQSLMTANVAMLNAQILSDLQLSPNGTPLIFAECNFQSRSDRAGFGAGLRVPQRKNARPAPQIIVQNVLVNDHQDVSEGKLRDFTAMYLPMVQIQGGYQPHQIEEMLQHADAA
jgi:hypothetical protein